MDVRDERNEPITVIVARASDAAGSPVWDGRGVERGRVRAAAWRARDLVGAAHVADAAAFDSRVTGRRVVRVLDIAAATE